MLEGGEGEVVSGKKFGISLTYLAQIMIDSFRSQRDYATRFLFKYLWIQAKQIFSHRYIYFSVPLYISGNCLFIYSFNFFKKKSIQFT